MDLSIFKKKRAPFDKTLFSKAIESLNGVHNFSAFTNSRGRQDMIEKNKNPIKDVKVGNNE